MSGAEIFLIYVFYKQAMIDCDLNIFDGGALTHVWHKLIQLGLLESMARDTVEPQPHLRKEIIVVQIMEKIISQHIYPVLIGTVEQLNELTAPCVRIVGSAHFLNGPHC